MTTPPIRRSTSSPPPSPPSPAEPPAHVGQARAAPDTGMPAALRRRTDSPHAERAPRLAAVPPLRATPARSFSFATPSDSLPPMHAELSLPSLPASTASGGSVQGPGSPPPQAVESHAPASPAHGSGSSAISSPDSVDSLGIPRRFEAAPANDREDVAKIIALLGKVAQGEQIEHLRVGEGLAYASAFSHDGQLKPRDSSSHHHLRQFHDKLDRLRAGAREDRALLRTLNRAMRQAGQRSWQRTAEIIEGLLEAQALLEGGYVDSKKTIADDLDARGLPHVGNAIRSVLLRSGVLKGPEHGSGHADALREHVALLRKSGKHAPLLAEWDALEAAQAQAQAQAIAARGRRTTPRTAPAFDFERRVRQATKFCDLLDRMAVHAEGIKALGGKAQSRGFAYSFDVEGHLTAAGQAYLQPLRESADPEHRQLVADIEHASIRAVQAHRDRTAATLQEVTDAVLAIKAGTTLKSEAVKDMRLAESKALHILRDAIDKDGFLQGSATGQRHVAALQVKMNRLHGSGDPAHQEAARKLRDALAQNVERSMRAPPDRPPRRVRAPRARGRPAARAALGAQTPSGSVGSFTPDRPGPAPSLPFAGARSSVGAGFEAGDEVQSRREPDLGASPERAQVHAPVRPIAMNADAVRRANATRDWVRDLIGAGLPEPYRQTLVQQAIDVERTLVDRGAPPLRDMLQHDEARLPTLVTPQQADTIRQLGAFLRPPPP